MQNRELNDLEKRFIEPYEQTMKKFVRGQRLTSEEKAFVLSSMAFCQLAVDVLEEATLTVMISKAYKEAYQKVSEHTSAQKPIEKELSHE